MVPSLLILSTLGSGQDLSVTNAYCTSRWLVRGLGAELATNLAGRGRKRWRKTLRAGGRRTPPPADGALAVVTGATGGLGGAAEIAQKGRSEAVRQVRVPAAFRTHRDTSDRVLSMLQGGVK